MNFSQNFCSKLLILVFEIEQFFERIYNLGTDKNHFKISV